MGGSAGLAFSSGRRLSPVHMPLEYNQLKFRRLQFDGFLVGMAQALPNGYWILVKRWRSSDVLPISLPTSLELGDN